MQHLAHEGNSRMLLLTQLAGTQLSGTGAQPFKAASSIRLSEQGFAVISHDRLLQLFPQLQGRPLPPLGASPDDVLEVTAADGSKQRFVVEYKSACPFKQLPGKQDENTQPGQQGQLYKYVPGMQLPKSINPLHYAQVQLHMLAVGAQQCLLVNYSIDKTHLRLVDFDSAWTLEMLQWVSRIWAKYWIGPVHLPPAEFASKLGEAQYAAFLEETAQRCQMEPAAQLKSIKGTSRNPFL